MKGSEAFLGRGSFAKVVLGYYNNNLIAAKCSGFLGSKKDQDKLEQSSVCFDYFSICVNQLDCLISLLVVNNLYLDYLFKTLDCC